MKKPALTTIAILCLGLASLTAQSKIGYLNTTDIFNLMPEKKQADSLLSKYQTDLQQQYSAYVNEYQQKLADYQQNSSAWSDVKKEAVEQDLTNLQMRISDFQQSSQDNLNAKQSTLYSPIYNKLKSTIEAVGAENKLTVVIDSEALYYTGPDATDISALVKKKLGLQ